MGAELAPVGTAGLRRLADEIRWHQAKAEAALTAAVTHWLAVAERLALVHRTTPYRQNPEFLAWANAEFGWLKSRVYTYLALAELFQSTGKVPDHLVGLPLEELVARWRRSLSGPVALEPPPLEALPHPFALPRNDYRIVLADPPWQYESWSGKSKDTSKRRVVEDAYDTMPLEAIKALPVGGACAPDAVLLCWATLPLLREALEVVAAWGFEYRTAFLVWGKLNADRTPAVGFGRYTRSNGELCLLGRRGKGVPVVPGVAVANLLLSQRQGHSAKPLRQYEVIDQVFGPDVPRVELFARVRMPRWDVWGLEAPEPVTVLDLAAGGG